MINGSVLHKTKKFKWTDDRLKKLVEMFKGKQPLDSMCLEFGICSTTVKNKLNWLGYSTRGLK